jgi:hypothetical protein
MDRRGAEAMKPASPQTRPIRESDSGATLVEVLVFFSLLLVFMAIGFAAYDRVWFESRRLEQRADAVRGLTQFGERWREDIRSASGPPLIHVDGRGMDIPVGTRVVTWKFEGKPAFLSRTAQGERFQLAPWALSGGSFSRIPRPNCTGWATDIQFLASRSAPRPPVLRFIAASSGTPNP